jgi:hypothetical protein
MAVIVLPYTTEIFSSSIFPNSRSGYSKGAGMFNVSVTVAFGGIGLV